VDTSNRRANTTTETPATAWVPATAKTRARGRTPVTIGPTTEETPATEWVPATERQGQEQGRQYQYNGRNTYNSTDASNSIDKAMSMVASNIMDMSNRRFTIYSKDASNSREANN
jgi:hypothetical protein